MKANSQQNECLKMLQEIYFKLKVLINKCMKKQVGINIHTYVDTSNVVKNNEQLLKKEINKYLKKEIKVQGQMCKITKLGK